ncbi:UNVERIFIED_ORG: hypothetical protein E4P37_16370 [Bacillus sp. AZ43]
MLRRDSGNQFIGDEVRHQGVAACGGVAAVGNPYPAAEQQAGGQGERHPGERDEHQPCHDSCLRRAVGRSRSATRAERAEGTVPSLVTLKRVVRRPARGRLATLRGCRPHPPREPTIRILLVCTGNVCRSAFAQRLGEEWLWETLGEDGKAIELSSAGTRAVVGSAMHPDSELALRGYGPDGGTSAHVSSGSSRPPRRTLS